MPLDLRTILDDLEHDLEQAFRKAVERIDKLGEHPWQSESHLRHWPTRAEGQFIGLTKHGIDTMRHDNIRCLRIVQDCATLKTYLSDWPYKYPLDSCAPPDAADVDCEDSEIQLGGA